MYPAKKNINLQVEIPHNHMLLPLIDFNWHFQSVVSPGATPKSDSHEFADDTREEFFRVFKAFDENGDGLVTKEEVGKLMKKLGHDMSENDLDLLMLIVDLNGDGCIDFDEFLALYSNVESSDESEEEDANDDNLMEAFRVFDRNNDGFITAEELHLVLSRLGFVQGNLSIAACRNMIRGVDANGDGLVDFSEFKDMMLSRPSPRAYFASMIEAN